jgi:hypothetical protein
MIEDVLAFIVIAIIVLIAYTYGFANGESNNKERKK